jgi:hypothetical protein
MVDLSVLSLLSDAGLATLREAVRLEREKRDRASGMIVDAKSAAQVWQITPNQVRVIMADRYPDISIQLLGGPEIYLDDLLRETEKLAKKAA